MGFRTFYYTTKSEPDALQAFEKYKIPCLSEATDSTSEIDFCLTKRTRCEEDERTVKSVRVDSKVRTACGSLSNQDMDKKSRFCSKNYTFMKGRVQRICKETCRHQCSEQP